MIAWLVIALLIGGSLVTLRLLGVSGGILTASAAALMLGGAGYAIEGHPAIAGSPSATALTNPTPPLTDARHAFFGEFSPGESWMRMSEALARTGRGTDAVGILSNAVGRYPGDSQLWIGLGNALVDQEHGMTPPAEYAYRRAAEVAPGTPAPSFFYGLALARSGDRQSAVAIWRSILATASKDASWRPLVEQGVAALGSGGARP